MHVEYGVKVLYLKHICMNGNIFGYCGYHQENQPFFATENNSFLRININTSLAHSFEIILLFSSHQVRFYVLTHLF